MKASYYILMSLMLVTVLLCYSCKKGTPLFSNDIVFQLNWTDDPTFTGEYIAKEKYWMLDKLRVTIKQGGLGIDPISMVITGKADYAVVGADKALMAIADGKPIRVISVDLQRNPVGWIARQDLKIVSFEDLRNRKDVILGDKAGTETSAILSLVLKRKNLNIKPQAVSFDFSYFLANESVVYPVYLNEEPVKASLVHDIRITEIDPSLEENGGIKLYGNVIITQKERTEKNPIQIEKLIKGLKSGWEYARNNPDDAVEIVANYVKNDKAYIRGTMERTVKFATDMYGKRVPAGHMEFTAWENTVDTLKDAGLIDKEIDLNQAVYMR